MTAVQVSIAELLSKGIILNADEAVAIALELLRNWSNSPGHATPQDPPLPENVYLGSDGTVVFGGVQLPAASEVALFLRQLLPIRTAGIPGGLHYAIARALQEVDAPPFDSVEDFYDTLTRFERSDRAQLLLGLLERAET